MTVSPLISDVHATFSLASSARVRDRVGQDEARIRFSSAIFLPLMLAGARHLVPFGSPALLGSTYSFVHSDIFQSYNVKFASFDPRRSPLELCDARRINLYPVGTEPVPRSPHATLRGVEGAPKGGSHLRNGVLQPCVHTVTIHLGLACSFIL
jgi:hypothetical protein